MSGNMKYYIFAAIRVAAFAASFLREAGIRLHRPIGIALTEDAAIDWLIKELPIFKKEILSSNASLSIFSERLLQTHDDILLVQFSESEKSHENIRCLLEATMSGQITGQDFCAVPLIVFDGFIPDSFLSQISMVLEIGSGEVLKHRLKDDDKFLEVLSQVICCNVDAFKEAVQRSWGLAAELTEAMKLLLSAKAVIELGLRLSNVSEEKKDYVMAEFDLAINEGIEFSDSYAAKEQIAQKFITCLRTLITVQGYRLIHIDQDIEGVNYMLYDAQTYYVPLNIFNDVCELVNFTSSVRIKRCLSEQGILKTEGQARSYYSRKIYGRGLDGKRFFWLDRSKIDRETDLNLTEI